jgi:hypothetical protein
MQGVEKLLEDARIKLSSVVSDLFGVSGQAMMHALTSEQRDPQVLNLVSWAKFCPQVHASAGRTKNKGRGGGNPMAGRHPRQHHRRSSPHRHLPRRPLPAPRRRRGKHRAVAAIGNTLLTIAYHLLTDPDARFHDFGAGHYESRINKNAAPATWPPNWKSPPARRYSSAREKPVITEPEVAQPPPTTDP